jgi:hypothetical protein
MSEETKELEDQIAILKDTVKASSDLIHDQLEQLLVMWAGSARSGRWLDASEDGAGDECSADTKGAEWAPYTDEEQIAWLREGVVPILERMLFEHDDKGAPIIPPELLAEHGFNEEPEDDTIYPRTNES